MWSSLNVSKITRSKQVKIHDACLMEKIWAKWISEREIPAQENKNIYNKRASSRNSCKKWKKWSHHLSMNLSQSFQRGKSDGYSGRAPRLGLNE